MGLKMISKKNGILAVDVGNTSVLFVYCLGSKFKKTHRIPTASLNAKKIASLKKIFPLKKINAVVIASVVPQAGNLLSKEIAKKFSVRTYLIGKDFNPPIINRYKNPKQVGVDRLVNAAEAFDRHHRDVIVMDFGTAITFDIVSKKGEYLGGVIAPGIEVSLEALYQKTALLPKIRLAHPLNLIGRDTVESIRVGCSVGIGGLCDRLVERIKGRYGLKPLVIATGGYAGFMRRYCQSIDSIDTLLTIKGILLSYKKFLTKKKANL